MKRPNSKYLKATVKWKLIGKRSRGHSKKRWNKARLVDIRDIKLNRRKSTK